MRQPLVILLCSMAALRGWTPSDVVVSAANMTIFRGSAKNSNDELVQSLLQCSSQTSETSTDNTRRLCSNDSSCIHYEDCCFDADVASNKASRKETRCVPLLDHKSVLRKVVMVTRCNDSWPEDEVRKGCEDAGAKNETFHLDPSNKLELVTPIRTGSAHSAITIAKAGFSGVPHLSIAGKRPLTCRWTL
ncbi:hypothetical protein HPB51_013819 [Rhipicephalus microplus]|uniref:Uncharacterized protein n=1 Tax=Rhipicephalus microplus TaxID=6941 RepID=A0A9J6F3T5_RHIMP|nr:hypothetical protein HPB51_013819 [Rhipicephalus microplus]